APAIPTPLPTVVNQPTAIQTPAPQVVQTGRLTGRVNLTGHVPSNSSILVLWRHPGENDFRVVTRLEARNGVTWTWDGAQAGRTYEIRLAFQVNDNNRNVSNIVSATAPANIELTLNTGEDNRRTVSGPTHTPVLENCGDRNGNYWRARIVLPRVDNARGYWVTMGTYQNGRNTLDRRMDGEGRQVVYVNVRNDREYFVRYAVRTNGDFGSFGATLRFRCSGTARSSSSNNLDFNDFSGFRGFRCDRDNRRCVTTQDHNAPFPNTRDGLDRCLSECN
ncbi:MAG: hypothetical protein LBG64_00240, partial [Pseudomonadales bacterium]|nr:hypothetical protein [Pseudomonadales bacterium]